MGEATGSGPDPENVALLEIARDVALEAAELVRARRDGVVTVAETKTSPVDVVTEADHASEDLIRRRLAEVRPDDGFLGEESGAVGSAGDDAAGATSGVTWVVDPIDGTVNFLYGLPQYAVSVAARRGDEVVAGVVVNVASGEVWAAVLGGGATCDGRPLVVAGAPPLDRTLVATGFSYDAGVRARQAVATAVLLRTVRDIRRLGSAALDLCAVAAGRVDAYVEEGLHPWDMAAGGLVATEAGARLESLTGASGRPCVVCAPSEGFDDFLALVRACGYLAG